jgi:hypothetical protein
LRSAALAAAWQLTWIRLAALTLLSSEGAEWEGRTQRGALSAVTALRGRGGKGGGEALQAQVLVPTWQR